MNLFTKRMVFLAMLSYLGSMLYPPYVAAADIGDKTSARFYDGYNLDPDEELTVSGTVFSDEDNLPLPGVTVLVKGTTRGVSTDADGKFTIDIPDQGAILVFSFIGFAPQEVEVYTDKELSITLKAELTSMNEVVVVGYGTTRKGDITSSIAGVKEENFVKGAVRDAGQLIQGKVAGLRVTTPSGDPGAGTQINLRGINSINGTSDPLVLIDGIPGTLNTVPPEDIESIDVLKDGSAAAIYGTRATGGVILITTRKVAEGKETLSAMMLM
ncbi:carboxypeptidase-like regulatory domain-containing protein [Algoriphagus sp. AGSA1]|uniref:carboxypeptidase-like regulatory domain-containing protein n=1 Tax=Algoriphagus sp. AGSA1 TaxID=2907213 RepID=UPI001F296C1B|nr:carboxypeptidase-like regulatory domain-containing protein [Algoriphagus sp. AGSA1]MCE7055224.1 carboxypeptidase-like regulatory domain-containing protein [Algoriphagus sp. AGSA1]